MHPAFQQFVESLNPSLDRMIAMPPVTAATLPRQLPKSCVYLFSEADRHLYAGRTRRFRDRMREQTTPGAQHNQAVFAFKLACELCKRVPESYIKDKGRKALACEPDFIDAFTVCKARVRNMQLRFVEESEPTRQALLEIYVSVALGTPYNDFNTH